MTFEELLNYLTVEVQCASGGMEYGDGARTWLEGHYCRLAYEISSSVSGWNDHQKKIDRMLGIIGRTAAEYEKHQWIDPDKNEERKLSVESLQIATAGVDGDCFLC